VTVVVDSPTTEQPPQPIALWFSPRQLVAQTGKLERRAEGDTPAAIDEHSDHRHHHDDQQAKEGSCHSAQPIASMRVSARVDQDAWSLICWTCRQVPLQPVVEEVGNNRGATVVAVAHGGVTTDLLRDLLGDDELTPGTPT
jgi:hypothetical protein